MMSKIRAVTKIFRCVELTDTLNTWWKRFIMIIIMLCYFEIFTSCQGSMRIFSRHYSKCNTVSIKFRKTLQERRLPILKFSQDNPKNNLLNFLTSKDILITLQYSRDILGIFSKQTFVECFSNILENLFLNYWNLPKDKHLLLSNHTLLTQKQLFDIQLFKEYFPLKCLLNVLWMSRTLQRWGNTQRIFPEYCMRAGFLISRSYKKVILKKKYSDLTKTLFSGKKNDVFSLPIWGNVPTLQIAHGNFLKLCQMILLLHKQTKLCIFISTAIDYIYSLPCYCSDFNDMLNRFSCSECTWFQWIYIIQKTVNCI